MMTLICSKCQSFRIEELPNFSFCFSCGFKDYTMSKPDLINHPPHYDLETKCPHCEGKLENFDFIRNMSFPVGNAIKYLVRYKKKGAALADLNKAMWYIKELIKEEEAHGRQPEGKDGGQRT